MINQFKVKQAFMAAINNAATLLSFDVIELDDSVKRPLDKITLSPFMLGAAPETIGLSDDSPDLQLGAYQIGIYTPKSKSENLTLAVAEQVKPYFSRGDWLEAGGQWCRVKETSQSEIMQDDTHRKVFLTVYYSVIA